MSRNVLECSLAWAAPIRVGSRPRRIQRRNRDEKEDQRVGSPWHWCAYQTGPCDWLLAMWISVVLIGADEIAVGVKMIPIDPRVRWGVEDCRLMSYDIEQIPQIHRNLLLLHRE